MGAGPVGWDIGPMNTHRIRKIAKDLYRAERYMRGRQNL
jgi:hypothetical protein